MTEPEPAATGTFPADLTIAEALERYFARAGFGRETYSARWVRLPIGPVAMYMPNIKPRRDVVPLHDVNHVLTEYDTDWAGEMSISGFELGAGLGPHWFGWLIDLQALWLGLLAFRPHFLRGFLRGRRSGSLYAKFTYDDALMTMKVGEARRATEVAPNDGLAWKASDTFALLRVMGLSALIHLPLVVPPVGLAWWLLAG